MPWFRFCSPLLLTLTVAEPNHMTLLLSSSSISLSFKLLEQQILFMNLNYSNTTVRILSSMIVGNNVERL